MDDLMWYKRLKEKFQMYTCDAEDGSFILYVTECHHWTFPKHSHKRFVSPNALIPEVESQLPQIENDFSRHISCIILYACCIPQHMPYIRIWFRVHVKFESYKIVSEHAKWNESMASVCVPLSQWSVIMQ